MPNIKGSPLDIMKAISMFDIDTDFDDTEAKKKLDILFHNLIVSDDPKAKEFLERFLSQVDNVIADMGVIEKPKEEEEEEEVDFDDEPSDEELPADDEELPADKPADKPVDDVDGDEEENIDEIPDDLLGAGYNPLISRANSFLNY